MDAFVIAMVGLVGGLFVFLLLLGRFYPGSGADQLDWHPTRSPEVEIGNEIDEVDQMRDAINAKRRKRCLPDLGADDVQARLAEDLREGIAARRPERER